MSDAWNPYEAWLGMAAAEQPPDYYRLLGVRRFEKRHDAIEAAAEARLVALRPHQEGEHGAVCQRLIREVNAAKSCLLNENRRSAYDVRLLQQVAAAVAEEERVGKPVQVTAAAFLVMLKEKDLASGDLLAALRKQIAESRSHVTARHVARLLIDKGLLTPLLVQRLLGGEAKDTGPESAARGTGSPQGGREELRLAPPEPEWTGPQAAAVPPREAPRPAVTDPWANPVAPKPSEAAGAVAGSAAKSLLDEEFPPLPGVTGLGAGSLDGLLNDPALAAAGAPLRPIGPPRRGLARLLPRRGFWKSPTFLVLAGIAWTVLILGGMLIWSLLRPTGDLP